MEVTVRQMETCSQTQAVQQETVWSVRSQGHLHYTARSLVPSTPRFPGKLHRYNPVNLYSGFGEVWTFNQRVNTCLGKYQQYSRLINHPFCKQMIEPSLIIHPFLLIFGQYSISTSRLRLYVSPVQIFVVLKFLTYVI